MAVKIVTDSLSDITFDLAEKLGVTVVPLTVLFGHESFLDRVTITTDEFYRRLTGDQVWPTTTQPPPSAFAEVYNKLAKETDEILVVTLSSELSGTYQSALQARDMVEGKCRIEVIDSRTVALGLGLMIITAARRAQAGASLDELAKLVGRMKENSHIVIYFDTLKYLARGGRIGRARNLLGSLLSIKPICTIKEGEISPITRVRSRAAGMDYLFKFASDFKNVEAVGVEHATTPGDADALVKRLSAIVPADRIYTSTVSPVIGVYSGPEAMAVSILAAGE
ncbi:MAG: DegV family protein [Chloroflexi bacterium]|nr:DegV family protein [Chloroflexota bacterium]